MELTANFFLMSLQDAELFHSSDIKDPYSLITGGAGHQVAVWRPFESLNGVFMLVSSSLFVNSIAAANASKRTMLRGKCLFEDPKT